MTSRKRSATKSPPPPDPLVFFIDRSLGKAIGQALRAAGAKVELHCDHFSDDAPDAEWLPVAGARKWVVLTKDKRIRFRPLELQAVIASKVRLFVLAGRGDQSGQGMIDLTLRNLRKMERVARKHPAPFIAGITQSGVQLYELREGESGGQTSPTERIRHHHLRWRRRPFGAARGTAAAGHGLRLTTRLHYWRAVDFVTGPALRFSPVALRLRREVARRRPATSVAGSPGGAAGAVPGPGCQGNHSLFPGRWIGYGRAHGRVGRVTAAAQARDSTRTSMP